MKRLIPFILLILLSLLSIGQASRLKQMQDSLSIVEDTSEIKLCIRISSIFTQSNTDSAFHYINRAVNLSNKINNPKFQAYAYRNLGLNYKLTGDLQKAEKVFLRSLKFAEKSNDKYIESTIYNNLGVISSDKGDYQKSLTYNMKALKINQELNDKIQLSYSYNNIGLVFFYIENYSKALEYYNKSLKYKIELNDSSGIALLHNNIGILYYFKDSIELTFRYFKKSLKIYEKLHQKRNSANTLSNIGELYYNIGLFRNSVNYYTEAGNIYKELRDTLNIATNKKLLAQLYLEEDYIDVAEKYLDTAYIFARKSNLKTELIDIYKIYTDLYSKKKLFKKSLYFSKKYCELKDSVFNINKSKAIEEVQTKYETKQKNQEIDLLNKEKVISKEKFAKQRLINFMLIGGIILFIFIIFLVIRQNIERKRRNNLLKAKNTEIVQQKEEITTQRDKIESQKNYVTIQHDLIKEQKDSITDSINYAKKIQMAVLPSENSFTKFFNDYFILFKPKDIVSGDFYWINKFDEYIVVALADCTGHGVPGGFMSMLGITYLTEIIRKSDILRPNQVLNELRDYIITALKQTGEINEQKDGMDFSLCFINTKTSELEYSGANCPIYIVDNNNIETDISDKVNVFEHNNSLLYEFKPDKMPIGHYPNLHSFSNIKVKLNKTSKIYMFSDGFPDQFGGEKGKKYTYKRFRQLFLDNNDISLKEQKLVFNEALDKWQNNNQQIDDITVLGFTV